MPKPSSIIRSKFPFNPTEGQSRFFSALDLFFERKDEDRPVLLLKGYAGTGKTTIVGALVKLLPLFNMKSVLMAPTGRAAKVMSNYAHKTAFTIHKKIYRQKSEKAEEFNFSRQKNYYSNTLFIVDEASMLSNESGYGENSLLDDVFEYVFEKEGNKLLLIGDNAQLPPVGKEQSPALDSSFLKEHFRCDVLENELTEVMRQEEESGILFNATALRNQLSNAKGLSIKFTTKAYNDTFRMTGARLEDGLRYAYDKYGVENSIIICRSNRNAVLYNEYIRRQIHFMEAEIEVGDMLMIVKNNYLFQPEEIAAGFLANGDFIEVVKVISFQDLYGFRFADLEVRLTDYEDVPPITVKVLLDTLHSNSPSLTREDYRNLYNQVLEDYQDLATKKELKEALKKDPYLNALQIKFAYALTCHKSQGGQWPVVFVDQGYLKDEMINQEYVRWLYTAITRSTSELYLVNFNDQFF